MQTEIQTEINSHLPTDFSPHSRIWIYQSSRVFFLSEVFQLEEMLNDFVSKWQAHGAQVKGYANLFFGMFVVIMADETKVTVSGCSTDSSVRLIKEIESKFGVQMFNRESLAFYIKNKVQQIPLNQLHYAVQNNFISAETLYFNNTVLTKSEFENSWITPVKDSWLRRYILAQNQSKN